MDTTKYMMNSSNTIFGKKVRRINPTIEELLDNFNNSKSGKVHKSRRELQRRFDYQSFEDQKKIIRAFMKKAVKIDVVWCSKYFVTEYADTVYLKGEAVELVDYLFWKDEYLDVVKTYWEHDMESYKLLKVVMQFDSPEYLKEKIKSIENERVGIIDSIAYSNLLLRICEDKSYPIPKDRLTPFQYAYISAKTNRLISEKEAVNALDWAAKNESSWPSLFVRNISGQLAFCDYKHSTIGLALWTLSQLGHSSVIKAFNEWIKTITKVMEETSCLDDSTINKIIQENLAPRVLLSK